MIFGANVDINITFNDASNRKRLNVSKISRGGTGEDVVLYLFTNGDTVSGQVVLTSPSGRRVNYTELSCALIGRITVEGEYGVSEDFLMIQQTLDENSSLDDSKVFDYHFSRVDLPHESYIGIAARVKYFLRVTMHRSYAFDVVEEQEIWVQNTTPESEINGSIKMEVGIEDCLHIEFEYNKSKYHLDDVVIGKIFFLLVKVKVQRMELSVLRREIVGQGANISSETETVAKFEIMDGAPVKGESIPVRLFLGGLRLTPTYIQVGGRFSVRNLLNLVLIDEDDRRYYKQQEITLWRRHL